MREIKFRAWNEKNKRMLDLSAHIFFTADGDLCFSENREHYIDSYPTSEDEDLQEEYKIMQYTGLKDINGKEIYEGDIVKAFDKEKQRYYNQEIIYDEYGYFAKDKDDMWLIDPDDEIIGNIYQNPELLKYYGTNKR
jgi:uncharacterized phage protein (TIGR01671 family)